MSEFDDDAAMCRVVDGYLHPEGKAFVLRFNRPGGATEHVSFPLGDVAVLADIAALAVRQLLGALHPTFEAATATSFDLGELPGAETVVVTFRRGSELPIQVALLVLIAWSCAGINFKRPSRPS